MSQPEISAMKEALAAQQRLLQMLYNELEAERESSATAASEALSVIIRLQGEKAAVKMEAEQYKRLAEERMCHAEESFAIVEDIIYQREMEVAALDDQLQSYRHRLGVVDAGSELTCVVRDMSLGRRNSAPVLLKQALMEWESEKMGQVVRNSSTHGEGMISSYAQDIMKLDIRVKEFAGSNFASPTSLSSRSNSMINMSCMPNSQPVDARWPCPRPPTAKIGKQNMNSCEAVIVQDIFEVPQVDEVFQSKDVGAKLHGGDHEPDWLKKLFQSTWNEFYKPSHVAATTNMEPATCLRLSLSSLPEAMIHFWL